MNLLCETVTDPAAQAESLRRRRHGIIDAAEGRVVAVRLRPFPKLISLVGVALDHWSRKFLAASDRCLLYYSQPRRFPNFLTLKYLSARRGASLATLRAALVQLEEIARLKRSDAILCEVTNSRISHRMLVREGWERHTKSRWRRNYIKRFYGAWDRGPSLPSAGASSLLRDGVQIDGHVLQL